MSQPPGRQIYHLDRLPERVRSRLTVPPALRVVLGLLALILLGTLALSLPGMHTRPMTFMEALFTATSSVTVTGLSVITAATDLTRLGQVTLLALIQLGGVGYMVMAVLTLRLLGRRVSLLDRLALSTSLGLDRPTEVLQLVRRALVAIVIAEGLGAIVLYIHWRTSGIVPETEALFYALFHAVSAFCNAGFDLFVGLPRYPTGLPDDPVTLLVMGVLVTLGGIGFPVIIELSNWRLRQRLSLHARITLWTMLLLTLVGWFGLLAAEFRHGVLAEAPLTEQVVTTWFQSVSTRTAGFPGLRDFELLTQESRLLVMALMFIGSAPSSMGGGITTGTFAVLMVGLISYARGLPRARIAGRSIDRGTVRRAGAVLTVSITVVIGAAWLILLTHDLSMDTVLFEVVSALATCGLSLGITVELNTFGRLVIMLMMFWGRLGALTIVIAILQRRIAQRLVEYPDESVLIG
ncbi:MAG: potassium transporter TrkG [Candidatus Promineifilaceae bacterium]|nr:potassium transporter TrkG [Candidatus Promineifilaceae bacterium]